MAGVLATGGTFSFAGVTAKVVAVNVESPKAQTTDMTSASDAVGMSVIVPTGEWSSGTVTVDYVAQAGAADMQALVRRYGRLAFTSGAYTVVRQAILESASTEIRVGELVRGSLRFVLTDYYG